MFQNLTLVTAPAFEPITTAEAKSHARVDGSDDDDEIAVYITAARRHLESVYGRLFCRQTWQMQFDQFPAEIWIPVAPVLSVDSITYVDTAGDTQTLPTAEYQADTNREPARIKPAYGYYWPAARDQFNAVTVNFTGGYAEGSGSPTTQSEAAENIPEPMKQAVRMLVSHWLENRDLIAVGTIVSSEMPWTTRALMAPFAMYSPDAL